MNNIKTPALLALLATMVLVTGCDSSAKPIAVALVWDPTITAAENEAAAQDFLRNLLSSSAFPKGTRIAIVRCDADPQRVWDGEKKSADRVRSAWSEAAETDLIGTDQAKAFDKALHWLSAPEQASAGRKILIMWSDLRPDTWKKGKTVISTPSRLESYPWPAARALKLEAFFLGVPDDRQVTLRRAWDGRFLKAPHFFGPRHELTDADLRLARDTSLLK